MLTRILPATVVTLGLGFAAAGFTWAQSPMGGGMPPGSAETAQAFRAYTLRSARAADAQGQLMQLLSALPVKTDVVVDERGNRLLVHGTPEAHQIVQRLVDSIDRPEPAAPNAAPLSPAIVESYSVPAELLPVLMGELRARFPAHLNVRMAADVPRNQLLVVAPKEVHKQIGDYLRTRAAQTGPTADEVARPNTSLMYLGRVEGRAVPIESAWETLYGKLKGVWGDRLTAVQVVNADPRAAAISAYTVQLTGGGALRLEYDPAGKQVTILGPTEAAANCARLLTTLDRPQGAVGIRSQVVPLGNAKKELVERAVNAVLGNVPGETRAVRALRPWETGDAGANRRRTDLVAMMFQKQPGGGEDVPPKQAPKEPPLGGGLTGNVEVYIIPELGLIILRGRDADVKKIEELIKEIIRQSEESAPIVQIYPLQHVDSEALSSLVTQLYSTVYAARSGSVSITPLVKPNALLLIGQETSVKAALELIKRLDTPGSPDAEFEIFRLRHMSARVAQSMLQQHYGANPGPRPTREDTGAAAAQPQLPGLFPRIYVLADYRTNSLIVRGAPRDLAEVAKVLAELDVPNAAAELTLRIFPLRNSLAGELATILQNAIAPPVTGAGQGQQQQQQQLQIPGLPQQGQGQQGQGQARAQSSNQGLESRSTALRLMTLDAKNKQILTSGILTDVQVTADARANALLVKAPENSMELIAKLIEQLDQIPGAEVGVKIFTVLNGDAQSLVQMLVALFGQQTGPGGQQQQLQLGPTGPGAPGQPAGQAAITGSAQGESLVVPLRFAVDTRTNSILATGSVSDLQLVELILEKLSLSDVKDRKTKVYRLRNVPADQVAQAINQYLTSERQVIQLGLPSAFEQIQQEVVVVPEIVTNSLIISATPRFYDEIDGIIKDLDRRPPMVMIQVLIAEVALNNTDEFGVELGLQDSVLFDRSLLSNIQSIQNSVQTNNGGAVTTDTQTNIVAANNTPGFAFNNVALGNSGAANATSSAGRVGSQGLSHFSVGRVNSELGFGGLVLSASSESVSVLVRALQECRRLEVLSRPQITTLNNQPAFVQVGQRVQFIQSTTINAQTNAQTNTLGAVQNVGLIMGVTPRVADDGRVAMEIDVEKSEVGPEAEGIPISVLSTGDVIRSPRINTTTAQTTVSSLSGQTIVLGGLITTNKAVTHRRVPLLASIPVLGHLFRYDLETQRKTELLIILTPRVIWEEEDAELIKQIESSRISWVLSDVQKIHGVEGLRTRWDSLDCKDIPVIYPDTDPRGVSIDQHTEEVQGAPGKPGVPDGKMAPGAIKGKPTLPGTPGGPAAPLPPGSQRPLLPRPPAVTPQGATQFRQAPLGPTPLPETPEGGPAIQPPQSPTELRPLSTAVPPGGPYPMTPPPGAVARVPNPGWAQPQAPAPWSAVQPAGYQAAYPAPAPAPGPWPPRGSVPSLAPLGGPQPPAPLPFNRPLSPWEPQPQRPQPQQLPPQQLPPQQQLQPQSSAEYRPWSRP